MPDGNELGIQQENDKTPTLIFKIQDETLLFLTLFSFQDVNLFSFFSVERGGLNLMSEHICDDSLPLFEDKRDLNLVSFEFTPKWLQIGGFTDKPFSHTAVWS